jgi:hypothetical protein
MRAFLALEAEHAYEREREVQHLPIVIFDLPSVIRIDVVRTRKG